MLKDLDATYSPFDVIMNDKNLKVPSHVSSFKLSNDFFNLLCELKKLLILTIHMVVWSIHIWLYGSNLLILFL